MRSLKELKKLRKTIRKVSTEALCNINNDIDVYTNSVKLIISNKQLKVLYYAIRDFNDSDIVDMLKLRRSNKSKIIKLKLKFSSTPQYMIEANAVIEIINTTLGD